jgi:hypothetical protein
MPKQLTFLVAESVPLLAGVWYLVRIISLRKDRRSKGVRVRMEHVDGDRQGEILETVLSLPVRTCGRTAGFFKACGCRIEVGQLIPQNEVVGRRIRVCLGTTEGNALDVSMFKSVAQQRSSDDIQKELTK